MGRGQEFYQFIPDALRADGKNFWSIGLKSFKSAGLNFEPELGGEPDCAQHSQVVFSESLFRRADGTNDFGVEILLAANPVMHFVLHRIKEQAVHREIAPAR